MNFIGIMGNAGVGKSTMANYLVKKYGYQTVALADLVKRSARDIFRFSDKQLWGPSSERDKQDLRYPTGKGFITPRKALQTLATDWARSLYPDVWVDYGVEMALGLLNDKIDYDPKTGPKPKAFHHRWLGLTNPANGVVIPDLRFANELKKIRKAGGTIVRLRRSLYYNQVDLSHVSETEQLLIPDCEMDFVLTADEGLESFHRQIDELMEKVKVRNEFGPGNLSQSY